MKAKKQDNIGEEPLKRSGGSGGHTRVKRRLKF
jgi:hypothetical protein